MQEKDVKFLEDTFKKYYFDNFDLIHVPERTSEREFGFQKFNSGMIRHISLKDDKELHLLLMQNSPSDVYCSNAYYSFPNLPMKEKDWKEADLIFDIDSKDLHLSCRSDHTVTKCNDCNKISKSNDQCTYCQSTKLDNKSLPCKNCIEASKIEVSKLLKILTDDFGIEENSINVYFSGNEGFHIYVYNSPFQELGSRERSELVDYIMFKGAIPETFGMKKLKPNRSLLPNFEDPGWRGRFSKEVYGSKSNKSKIVTELMTNGYSNFQKNLEQLSNKIGAKIDPNVTMDIHRIFRLPGSINSKSGLTKLFCKDLQKFDPYQEACILNDNSIEIKANCPIEFKLKNKKFGPYDNEIITVPSYSAAYMICKNLATIP
ncbi:MAG: DNA primase [Nitrososphaeria archaeon]|nr:DNA primase [Nitrosopumilaceae archaeon]NIP09482.1 DNA primase [Nitrosopumilaceae archaeon]NIP91337.1 DNA primase [Nitrososphaeria archaeon]NIS94347.1 DNA primase [Nitrosopumilaceae archaeon]